MERIKRGGPAASRRRRRRRPGELWETYLATGKLGRELGYVVTTGGNVPAAVALVTGPTKAAALRTAEAIRRDHARAGTLAGRWVEDLRGQAVPERLLGYLLEPIDHNGRVIASDGTFAAIMYVGTLTGDGPRYSMHVLTHAGMDALTDERVKEERDHRTNQPATSEPASKGSEGKGSVRRSRS